MLLCTSICNQSSILSKIKSMHFLHIMHNLLMCNVFNTIMLLGGPVLIRLWYLMYYIIKMWRCIIVFVHCSHMTPFHMFTRIQHLTMQSKHIALEYGFPLSVGTNNPWRFVCVLPATGIKYKVNIICTIHIPSIAKNTLAHHKSHPYIALHEQIKHTYHHLSCCMYKGDNLTKKNVV